MKISADLKKFECCFDAIEREIKAVNTIIYLLSEKKNNSLEATPEFRDFLEKQLNFMKEEKQRILLRQEFIQNVYEDLRYADNKLKSSLQTADNILSKTIN